MKQRVTYFGGLAVVVGVYALATLPLLLKFPPVWPDEVLFYSPAAALARGQGMGTSVLAGFLPGIDRYTYWQPPGYFFFLSLVLRFVPLVHHFLAMRLFSWILGAVILIIGAAILNQLAPNKLWALLGLIVLGTQVGFMQSANVGRMEMLSLTLVMAALKVYLTFREDRRPGRLAAASLLSGIALICHPAGIMAAFVIVVREFMPPVSRLNLGRNALIFTMGLAAASVPWLIYIAQAPNLFLAQMAAQSARKSTHLGALLANYGYKYWLLSPFGDSTCPLGYRWVTYWPFHFGSAILIPILILTVGLGALAINVRGRGEASILGIWALGGYALTLSMPEFWYVVHFITPCCLLLGWGLAESSQAWMRATCLAVAIAAAAWNYGEVNLIRWDCQDSWFEYKFFCQTLMRLIPEHSTVVLAAIPDPYFGLSDSGKSYQLYEFVPDGVRVDRGQTDSALDKVDYVVGSDCCRPEYLVDYLNLHGKIEARLGRRDFVSPPVVLWRLGADVNPSKLRDENSVKSK